MTEYGYDGQWDRGLEEDVKSAARQAWIVYRHHVILVGPTSSADGVIRRSRGVAVASTSSA